MFWAVFIVALVLAVLGCASEEKVNPWSVLMVAVALAAAAMEKGVIF